MTDLTDLIDVTVNGDQRRIEPGTTVDAVALELAGRREGTAVAVNDEVVPRSRWQVRLLADGDRVEVLTARQGG